MVIRKFTRADEDTYLALAAAFYQDGDAVDHVVPAHHAQRTFAALMDAVRAAYPEAARFRLEVTADNVRATRMYRARGYVPLAYDQMILDFPPPKPQE